LRSTNSSRTHPQSNGSNDVGHSGGGGGGATTWTCLPRSAGSKLSVAADEKMERIAVMMAIMMAMMLTSISYSRFFCGR
jgi:hypothetical protein